MKEKIKNLFEDFRAVPSYLVALSAVATVLMNLLANKTLYSDGVYLSLDCGFIISWVMFLVMDIATQKYGGKASIAVTLFDVVVALFMSLLMLVVSAVPETATSGWFQSPEIATALNGVIGNSLLVVLTSLFAFICSSGVDVGLNVLIGRMFNKSNKFKGDLNKKTGKGFLIYFVRAYGSTFFSQLVDNLVFQSIAYPLLFNMPCSPFSIFMGALLGAVAELIMEIVFAPIGFAAITRKKEA